VVHSDVAGKRWLRIGDFSCGGAGDRDASSGDRDAN
jgi:hypothetical protein